MTFSVSLEFIACSDSPQVNTDIVQLHTCVMPSVACITMPIANYNPVATWFMFISMDIR